MSDRHRREAIVVGILLCSALASLPIGAPAEADSSQTPIIVGFYEMPDERDTYQGEPVTDESDGLGFLVVDTDDPDRFREEARQDDRVRYLEEDHNDVELAYTPNDPRYGDQYGPQVTETGSAWDVTTGSTAVVVGIVDSGLVEDHEDIDGERVQDGYDHVNDDSTPEDTAACGYHGTHVAGIAGATMDNGKGIAGMSQHTLTPRKIFDEDSAGNCAGASASDIAQALEALGDLGAHVSSNSWSAGGSSTTLNQAIDYAHEKGVIHVAAAGNDGPCTDCVGYPWRDRPGKTIVVACTDANDDVCAFSSQGPEVDVAAPGYKVLSLDGSGYTEKSGTSMSTPHVSGGAALRIADGGDDTFATIEGEIADSADDIGYSAERQGGGRLDVGELVTGTSDEAPSASFTTSCDDLACTFDASDSVDPDGSITSYDWDFGDGTTATGEVVDHTYDSGGDYAVTLNVTDDDGLTDEDAQTVSVSPNQPPEASFSSSCDDLACTFDGRASTDDSSITSYDWDFGDGTTASGGLVDHTYDSGGDYAVTLNVTDDDGLTDEETQTVSVSPNQPPTAVVQTSCEDLTCTFDATDSTDDDGWITSYDWGLGDGTTASGEIVEHTYDEPGDYTATVIVTDDDGASDTTGVTVSVGGPSTMHVHGIDHRSRGLDAEAVVEVYAEDGTPVNGALATVEMCNAEGVCEEHNAKTGPDGSGAATWENGVGGAFTSCVTRLVHGDLSYAPADDHAADGNCASGIVLPLGLYP